MPPVRRHRIGDQLPAVIHPGPDPAAIDLCRELAAETDAQAVVLFGSRAAGGWDEQSDLDMIIVRPAAESGEGRGGRPSGGLWSSSGNVTTQAAMTTTAPITAWWRG